MASQPFGVPTVLSGGGCCVKVMRRGGGQGFGCEATREEFQPGQVHRAGVSKHHASSWPRPRGRELEGFIEKGRASIGQKAFLGQGRGSYVSLSPATSRRRVQR